MFTFASGRSLRRVLRAGLCAATLAEWRWREMRLCPTTDIRFPGSTSCGYPVLRPHPVHQSRTNTRSIAGWGRGDTPNHPLLR